jgi:hypothetical protein
LALWNVDAQSDRKKRDGGALIGSSAVGWLFSGSPNERLLNGRFLAQSGHSPWVTK